MYLSDKRRSHFLKIFLKWLQADVVLLQADVLHGAGQQSPHRSGQRVLHREHTALPDVIGYCRLLEASYLFMALSLGNSYTQAVCHTALKISLSESL